VLTVFPSPCSVHRECALVKDPSLMLLEQQGLVTCCIIAFSISAARPPKPAAIHL
jgi:hypothetical protein